MSNEIRVTASLSVNKGNLRYQNQGNAFLADMAGNRGQVPGGLTVPAGGRYVSFDDLTSPGWCLITNVETADSDAYVEWGLYDPSADQFWPVGELLPGESCVLRLSRNLLEQYEGTGTGTTAPVMHFFMKAPAGDCNVVVNAFEA
jgi:hypothetical protein